MKLIKINPDHYVIVDDSLIKEGDWYIRTDTNIMFSTLKSSNPDIIKRYCKKITYSTQPLELVSWENGAPGKRPAYDKIKKISVEEVKELIGEVDVEMLGYNRAVERKWNPNSLETKRVANEIIEAVKFGYNQALEDNKDRKYTEEDMRKAIADAWVERGLLTQSQSFLGDYLEKYIQSLQPKTEWEVTFNEQNKLQLI